MSGNVSGGSNQYRSSQSIQLGDGVNILEKIAIIRNKGTSIAVMN